MVFVEDPAFRADTRSGQTAIEQRALLRLRVDLLLYHEELLSQRNDSVHMCGTTVRSQDPSRQAVPHPATAVAPGEKITGRPA